jgi:hypothetical protein
LKVNDASRSTGMASVVVIGVSRGIGMGVVRDLAESAMMFAFESIEEYILAWRRKPTDATAL